MNEQIICNRCCMDKSAEEISFNENGVCNFCIQAQKSLKEIEAEKDNLYSVLEQIKKDGKGKDYDILIGLSGGVDSSTALHYAVLFGLRPLCFSVDTGYNKADADENIMKLVEGLKVPFYRYVIDLKKFKELQGAFLRSGVPNIEIPTDHVLMAVTYEIANQYGIKWILSGGNVASESIMPPSWGANARDLVHIKDIYKRMTGKKLTGLPMCSLLKWNWYKNVKKIKTLYLLDYFEYNREESEQMLIEKYEFKSTGGKHEENYFTWWFQNFFLFEKFGFDKRKAHLSSLINSGQITRSEALFRLSAEPVYPKLGIEERVMKYPKTRHEEFAHDNYDSIAKLIKLCKL